MDPLADPNFLAFLNGQGSEAQAPVAATPAAPPPVDPNNAVAPLNVLQAAQTLAPAAGITPAPVPMTPLPAVNPMELAAAQPRRRVSLIDTIGKISDVLANVGGAPQQYQPRLDAALARTQAAEDRPNQVAQNGLTTDLMRQKLAAGQVDMAKDQADADTKNQALAAGRYGAALRGIQAIAKANPSNIGAAWPVLAKQAGLSDDDAAHLGAIIQSNPQALDGLAAEYEKRAAGGSGEYGLAPVYATDGKGGVRAFQLSKAGGIQEIALPDGFHPAPQTAMVDQGGQIIPVDKRTGAALPGRVYVKSQTPDAAAKLDYQVGKDNVATGKQQAKDLQVHNGAIGYYTKGRAGLQAIVDGLDSIANDRDAVDYGTGGYGAVTSHLPGGLGGASAQRLKSRIETLTGRTIPAALNLMRQPDGKLGGFRPSQVEILGDAKGLTGALSNTRTSAADYRRLIAENRAYVANKIAELDEDAVRNGYATRRPDGTIGLVAHSSVTAPPAAPRALPPRAGAAPAPRPVLRAPARKPGAAPTVSHW